MKNTLQSNPAYLAATERVARLQNEMARLDSEIADHQAAVRLTSNAQQGEARLIAGMAVLDGSIDVDVRMAELARKRDTLAAAITPAHREIENVERTVSSAYWRTRANDVLAALDCLVAALDSVVAAGAAFKAIRDDGAKLGYSPFGGVPIEAEIKYTEFVNGVLPELRRDAERLRYSLDPTLDTGTLYIRALIDLPAHGLRIGDSGAVPTRQARTLILDGRAEETDAREKLRRLVA